MSSDSTRAKRNTRIRCAGSALFGCLSLLVHGTAVGDITAGARLAAAHCASCHSSTAATHATLPLLEGQPIAYFLAQWEAFRQRKRFAAVKVGLAAELSDRDLRSIAEHYAALSPVSVEQSSGSDSGRALADRLECARCHGPAFQGTAAGAARLAGQKARYTAWSLQLMRSGTRSHAAHAGPDPLIAGLSNAEIESLAAHFASLR